jgi:prophage maintenance system killer protein
MEAGKVSSTKMSCIPPPPSHKQKCSGSTCTPNIPMMAAAYLFHFAASQGFIDGNKRTGAATATEFLARNGYMLSCG